MLYSKIFHSRGAEITVLELELIVRTAKRRDFGAGAQAQAQTDQNWQNEARTERREDRTEIERHAAIHTGAPIGDDDRISAMAFH